MFQWEKQDGFFDSHTVFDFKGGLPNLRSQVKSMLDQGLEVTVEVLA